MDALLRREREEQERQKTQTRRGQLQKQLQRSRDTLRELEERKEQLEKVYESLLESHVVGEDASPPLPLKARSGDVTAAEAAAQRMLHNLRSVLSSYCDLGMAVEEVEGGNVQVAYHCHPTDRDRQVCQVLLQLSPPSLVGHTLPGFVPVWTLAKQHLPGSIADFLQALGHYMRAFGQRWAAVEDLKRSHSRQVEVEGTEPLDLVSVRLRGGRRHSGVLVKLACSHLLATWPDQVSFCCLNNCQPFPQTAMETAEAEFRKGKLSKGVETLLASV